jgi:ADP-heptose:LPS heptosyltransferase
LLEFKAGGGVIQGKVSSMSKTSATASQDGKARMRGKYRRIGVFRALYLGDMLCAVPAFRALRRAHPNARICLIGLPWARDFARRFDAYFDEFLEFPGFPGLHDKAITSRELIAFLEDAHSRSLDTVIQMHGSGVISNSVVALLGTAGLAGYYLPGHFRPAPETFLPYPEGVHEIRKHLLLADHLGWPYCGDHLEFPLVSADFDEVSGHVALRGLGSAGKPYVCLHPGSRDPAKRWSVRAFAEVGDALAGDGFDVVVTGSREESWLADTVLAGMNRRGVNAARAGLDIGALGALVKGAALVVTNDTGVSHLATALAVRSIVVFMQPKTEVWAPLDRHRHRALYSASGVGVAEVLAIARELCGGEGFVCAV